MTAINVDESNNTILHTGSQGYDVYTIVEGYGTAANVTGSYKHEFIGFANNYIFTPFTVPTVSLPEDAEWEQEDDRAVWTQNGFTVTVLGNANIFARGAEDLPEEPIAETSALSSAISVQCQHSDKGHKRSDGEFSGHKHWDESLYACLAEEHVRSQRKKDKWHSQDEGTEDRLAGLEKLALLELVK